ncbi:MAG: pilus assembly protein TadG-related protein [Desulfobacterales bacterium]
MTRTVQHVADRKGQNGATIVVVAICLVVLIGFAALAIDIGFLYSTRNELQNTADAGALAGAGYLGQEYLKLPYLQQRSRTFTQAEVAAVVNEVTQQNRAAGVTITIAASDVIVGNWNGSQVIPNPDPSEEGRVISPDAVQVTARRDATANSPITTFFARALGILDMPVSAVAVAALTGPSEVAEGELKTPFGLSENVFPNNCRDLITFSPTTSSCAGWHNFFDPINASRMEKKLLGLIEGHRTPVGSTLWSGRQWLETNFDLQKSPNPETTPETSTDDSYEFQGGTISSLFNGSYLVRSTYNGNTGTVEGNAKQPAPFLALYDYFRYRDDDGDDSVWTATIPVYKDFEGSCRNPNTAIPIVGFAKIIVRMPNPPPDSNVSVTVDCNLSVVQGRGGGGTYGNLKGSIPNLVK